MCSKASNFKENIQLESVLLFVLSAEYIQ